jgi:predicted dehydrogenase
MKQTKVLVIGLGSMGQRRIRCLNTIGEYQIFGFDKDKQRQYLVCEKFKINELNSFIEERFDFFIISTSPESHHLYIEIALKNNIHAFVEASVLDIGYKDFIQKAKKKNIIIGPSCTLLFHPAIIFIKSILKSKQLGDYLNLTYNSGQYLPDWHPYENVSDFYVSKKSTGAAREIVPFELTWLMNLFGYPSQVSCIIKKTANILGASEIDDTYFLMLEYEKFIMNLNVDIVSRKATRKLLINFEKGQLSWDWNLNEVQVFEANNEKPLSYSYEVKSHEGYNENISEKMYVDELSSFINSLNSDQLFPNNLEKDSKILSILYLAEKANDQGNKQFLHKE